ncbi:hypothetical protein FQN60_004120, partial [Etheostoma spectabile]
MRDLLRFVKLQSCTPLVSAAPCEPKVSNKNHGHHHHHHKRKLKLGAQQEARPEFGIITVDDLNVGTQKTSAAQSCSERREEEKQSRVGVFIRGARSGGCRAGVEERLGGAATPACSLSEPQSHTSSRGAPLCSAGRSRRSPCCTLTCGISAACFMLTQQQLYKASLLSFNSDRTSARPPKPTIRRTLSLDAIVAPYLQGQWPKEAESTAGTCVNDKATQPGFHLVMMNCQSSAPNQPPEAVNVTPCGRKSRVNVKKSTPSSWAEETRGRKSAGKHKRSASWGSAEHLREASTCLSLQQFINQVAKLRNQLQKRSRHVPPSAGYELPHNPLPAGHAAGVTQTFPLIPLNRLAPRLRRSVEGLNLELEEVFVSEKPEDLHEILDIPDGHRAPVPVQRCSSGSQSEPSPGPLDLDPSLLSPSQSPCPLDPSLVSPSNSPSPLNPSLLSPSSSPSPMGEPEPVDCETLCPAPSTLPSFKLDPPLLQPCSSAPRPNKTYGFQREPPEGCERVRVCEEAFLLKPLLPSMDLLFRGLSVSPVTGCPGQASPTRHLGM